MLRPLPAIIVAVWLTLLGVLLARTHAPASAPLRAAVATPGALQARDEWLGMYRDGKKIGYSHTVIEASDTGFVMDEESLLRLAVMDTPQTVRLRMRAETANDLSLRRAQFDLTSGIAVLHADATVDDRQLHLVLHAGEQVSEQTLPLARPLFLPAAVHAGMQPEAFRPDAHLNVLVFDPTALSDDELHVHVIDEEAVPDEPGVQAWRVEEEFRGIKTTSWLDRDGHVLREQGPMNMVLRHETAQQAVNDGWSSDALLDVVATAAVPARGTIADARACRQLRLRLTAPADFALPSAGGQQRIGTDVVIRRPAIAALQSYALPYGGTDLAADLQSTALLQADHPRLRGLVQEILHGERDASRATQAISDWVYRSIRKVPTVSLPNALQVLDMGQGDCNEHATLFTALSRAAGIPAHLVAGLVYLDGAFYFHAWSEVWLHAWVPVDPTFGQFPADATHVALVVGDTAQQLAIVGLVGRLQIEVVQASSDVAAPTDGPAATDAAEATDG